MGEDQGPSRLPLWLAAAASAGWLAWAALALPPPAPADLPQLVAILVAPIAALFALAAAAMVAGLRLPAPAAPAQEELELAEAALAGSITRVDALKQALAADMAALSELAETLPARGTALAAETARLRAEGDTLGERSRQLDELIAGLGARSDELTARLEAAVTAAAAQAEAMDARARGLGAAFADARATAVESAAALEALQRDLDDRLAAQRQAADAGLAEAAAEGARQLAAAEAAAREVEQLVRRQADAVAASVDGARATLAAIGGEATTGLSRRLESIAAEAGAVDERLKAQIETVALLSEQAEKGFQRLDARLAHAAENSGRTFDQLGQRIAAVQQQADGVAGPLAEGRRLASELEEAVNRLRATALDMIDALGDTVPARTVEASQAADTMAGELRQLLSALEEATAKVAALAAPVEASRTSLLGAASAFAGQQAAMETAGQALVVELEQARQLIADVEQATRDTSLAAATRLVDAMTRVREVAQQAAGTMRETLDKVIGEARDSLATAADSAMRQSFAEPVRAQAEAAEAAAAAAAQRTAASMAALAGTLKLLEDRSSSAREGLDEALRADLNAAAGFLEDRMAAASVSIASALDKPMTDADWEAWQRGERRLFNRRAVQLLDRRDAGALRSLIASDPAFADAARRYTAAHQSLMARLGDGTLAAALRNSDTGRLAAALSEALAQ